MTIKPSAVPSLIDAIVARCTDVLPGVSVTDGDPHNLDVGDYLCIGVEDPESSTPHRSADVSAEWAGQIRAGLAETGVVSCAAISWSSDLEMKPVRDSVYAVYAAVCDQIAADPRWGVHSVVWTTPGDHSLEQGSSPDGGTAARLRFSIHFTARLREGS